MFIKKRFFNYQICKISKNCVKIKNLILKDFDEITIDGVLLIVRKGNLYNFYLPSLEAHTSLNTNILCVFSDIKDYIYKDGLLFVKENIDNNFTFNVIEPNSFSWYLTRSNLQKRKDSIIKIPCKKDSKVEFFDFKFSHGLIINIDRINYFISCNNSVRLNLKKIDGNVRATKIYNTAIVSNRFGEAFFEDGNLSGLYSGGIKEFNDITYPFIVPKHYSGYLCYDSQNQIVTLRIGTNRPNCTEFDYSYTIDFKVPLLGIKFVEREVISLASDHRFPSSAIDIWEIKTKYRQKRYLFKGFGEKDFVSITDSKEDFF